MLPIPHNQCEIKRKKLKIVLKNNIIIEKSVRLTKETTCAIAILITTVNIYCSTSIVRDSYQYGYDRNSYNGTRISISTKYSKSRHNLAESVISSPHLEMKTTNQRC